MILQNSGTLTGWGTTYNFAVTPNTSHPNIRSAIDGDSFHEVRFDEGTTLRNALFYRLEIE